LVDSLGFDDLMLRFRGRTRLTQRQLAARLGVNARSIQAWEPGASYPSTASLQALIGTYLDEGAFTVGDKADEAESLWTSALEHSTRLRPPFERAWFDDLLAGKRGASHAWAEGIGSPPRTIARTLDWDGAPDDAGFVGRSREVDLLTRWVLDPECRMVAVLGARGVGKTRLAARVAREVAPRFEYVYWRSARNAPSVASGWAERSACSPTRPCCRPRVKVAA
jgi:transcriptional regulator with XRE-family HTH domain